MATTTLTGSTSNEILSAPGSVSTLVEGLAGNDTITLVLAADEASGGAGDDSITLAGAAGISATNTISGGEGSDSVFVNTAASQVAA